MDDLEGKIIDEKFYKCALGEDILSADLDCEDALLLNVGQHHASAVTNDLCRGIDDKGVDCVSSAL